MELRKGYKQTEIGFIPNDWNLVYLKDISSLKGRIGWQGLKQEEFTMNSDQPFLITGMNFKDGEIRWDEVYHVPFDRYELAKEIQLRESDVLMTKDGTIGKMLYVSKIPSPGYATLNSHLLLFRPLKKSYFPKYLYYNFHSTYFKKFIEDNKSGTTFFGISQESVGKYLFILPPIKEQTAIATALSDTDAWINSLEQLLTKKHQIKQGAMQELLKAKEGWEVKKLGEIATIVSGGTPSTNIDSYWNGKINWFTPTEIGAHKYVSESKRKISTEGLENSSARILPVNTIILTTRAGIGDLSILKIEACTNQGFQAFISNSSTDYEYLYYLLSTLKKEFLKNASGSTFLEISPNKLKSISIAFPSLKEQTHLATILSDMDEEIAQLESKLEKAKQLKQGMMQELLTGRIRLV
jgi:type I restriction enzyme S subunit